MTDERALLMAVPLRHLERSAGPSGEAEDAAVVLPAGGPGDLDAAAPGMPVLVMATDAGEAEVPAATWRASFVRRVAYEPGADWPAGLPATWVEEHPVAEPAPSEEEPEDDDPQDDDPDGQWDDAWDDDEPGPQSFVELAGLHRLPREDWLFANELVGKQARGGRAFLPRVPLIVALPD